MQAVPKDAQNVQLKLEVEEHGLLEFGGEDTGKKYHRTEHWNTSVL